MKPLKRKKQFEIARKILLSKGVKIDGEPTIHRRMKVLPWRFLYERYCAFLGITPKRDVSVRCELIAEMKRRKIWNPKPYLSLEQRQPDPILSVLANKNSRNSLRKQDKITGRTGSTPIPQTEINEFYQSYAWKRLRLDVLEEYGESCMACKMTSNDGVVIHVDHILPLRKFWGRRLEFNNLQVLCNRCNWVKGSNSMIDLRPSRKGVA